MSNNSVKSIVLVHGGFVDGSGWESVYKTLTRDGYKVSIVQNSTTFSVTCTTNIARYSFRIEQGDQRSGWVSA